MNKLIIAGVVIFGLYMFLKPTVIDLAVDNPTDSPITVTIDQLSIEVPPREVVWVEMGKGEHTVTLEDGSTHPFDYTSGAYFLNPTQSEYLVTEEFFGGGADQMSYALSNPDRTVVYMGMEIEGRYEVVKDLVSKVTWDVGAREQMPESVQADEDENYVVMKKLIGPSEFMDQIRQAMQQAAQEEG